jgi:hypothetical protein
MNDGLLETLLHMEEGTALDFKQAQYEFEGATEPTKSELLKDILSFANAWRATDAYILVGVQEVRGGRSVPVGIEKHLAESSLQQYVNQKTNRPVDFSYEAYGFEGKQIGIITVRGQERPIYLTRDCGKLKKNVVYIRRGSSTDEATLEEVAQMGRVPQGTNKRRPILDLQFGDSRNRGLLGTSITKNTVYLVPMAENRIPDYRTGGSPYLSSPLENREYYREYSLYKCTRRVTVPLQFVVTNLTEVTCNQVRIETVIDNVKGLLVCDERSYPEKPSKSLMPIYAANVLGRTHASQYDQCWVIKTDIGKVLPKEMVRAVDCFYLGMMESGTIQFDARVFCEEAGPQTFHMSIAFDVASRDMTMDDLRTEDTDED